MNEIMHKNYCGYARSDLYILRKHLTQVGFKNSIIICKLIIKSLRVSQKFALPTDGIIDVSLDFNESNGDMFKLPFDMIAAEYDVDTTGSASSFSGISNSLYTRRIVLALNARSLSDDDLKALDLQLNEVGHGVIVWPISYHTDLKTGVPSWCGTFVPNEPVVFSDAHESINAKLGILSDADSAKRAFSSQMIIFGEYGLKLVNDLNRESSNLVEVWLDETIDETSSIIGLCVALNCENVYTQKTKPAPRNIAKEKMRPKHYFEYKSLVINTVGPKVISEYIGGTHASPTHSFTHGTS